MANLGDIVASLAPLRKYHELSGRKVRYIQCVNQLAAYYNGATHPTVNKDGQFVTINEQMFDMMKPLVESQHFIHTFEKYEGQKIDLNFDVIRGQTNVNMPHGMLAAWPIFAFPDLACDLSKPWIILPDAPNHPIKKQVNRKIILNFTERYRSNIIDYFFLKNFVVDLVFAGTEREHFLFCDKFQLNIPRLKIKNFLDYAYAIKYSRFILANQSFGWNIAEAMKTPRILEVCSWADNCQPFVGEDSYGFFYQVAVEHYFRHLYDKTAQAKAPTK